MPLFCASHTTQLLHNLVVRRNNLTSKHVGVLLLSSSKCCLAASSSKVGLSENAASLSGFHRTSPSIMEDEKLGIIFSETEEHSTELDVAVRIVQMACFLCQRVQESLISKGNNQVKSKDDNSPVTVAGNCIDCLQNGFFLVILYALLCATYFSSITVTLNGTLAFILFFIIFFWRVFFQFFPLCYYFSFEGNGSATRHENLLFL
uniref:Uncharacterized protein n=1 Tax=Nelumbo nucifera TaxID=4432 RepID=A0A822ZW31_NELNU|nr:TPA_asm: hypothetical protein HUJ06_017678 [Nelumbo nucifera]